jgi:TatD DNase family protein
MTARFFAHGLDLGLGLVDIGANLGNKAFRDDLQEVLARALDADVEAVVVTGTSVEGSRRACELAARPRERSPRLFATAGIHPHHAPEHDEQAVAALRELCTRSEVVALGECGLDFDRNFSPRADQLRCFEGHLELAAELQRPLFLHERAAHEDFARLIATHRSRISRGVVHCFTGTGEELARYLDLDMYIGITGWICDERRGAHLREIVGRIPRDRLMIETDAPYLMPRDLRPKPRSNRNEPALLAHVLRAVAAARGESAEDVARATTATARSFFALP